MEELEKLLQLFMSDPQMSNRAQMLARERSPEFVNILNKVKSGTNIVSSLLGMAEGASQKREGKKALAELQRPNLPPVAKTDPALGRIAGRAEAKAISPERFGELDAYNQQMRRTYQTGLEQARTASGGQAGMFGSRAQSLYNDRLASASQLPAATAQISRQYDQLAMQSAAEKAKMDSYNYMNNLNRSGMAFDQYNKEAQAGADLYRTGAENFYNSLNFGLNALQRPLAEAAYGMRPKTGIKELDEQQDLIDTSWGDRMGTTNWQADTGFMRSKINPMVNPIAPQSNTNVNSNNQNQSQNGGWTPPVPDPQYVINSSGTYYEPSPYDEPARTPYTPQTNINPFRGDWVNPIANALNMDKTIKYTPNAFGGYQFNGPSFGSEFINPVSNPFDSGWKPKYSPFKLRSLGNPLLEEDYNPIKLRK